MPARRHARRGVPPPAAVAERRGRHRRHRAGPGRRRLEPEGSVFARWRQQHSTGRATSHRQCQTRLQTIKTETELLRPRLRPGPVFWPRGRSRPKLWPPDQIQNQTSGLETEPEAVYDLTESRFGFRVNPYLDSPANRMVWIRRRRGPV